ALGKQVYDLSGRELDLGLLGLAEFAPAALLVLVTGTVADRVDRRRQAGLAALGQGAVALVVAAYVAGRPPAVGPLVALAVLFGVARAFMAPAVRSLPADVVPPALLPWLVARWTVTLEVARIVGPVVAGTLYALDPAAPFLAAAGLGLAAALTFSLIPPRPPAGAPDPPAAAPDGAAARESAAGPDGAGAPAEAPARLHDALGGARKSA